MRDYKNLQRKIYDIYELARVTLYLLISIIVLLLIDIIYTGIYGTVTIDSAISAIICLTLLWILDEYKTVYYIIGRKHIKYTERYR